MSKNRVAIVAIVVTYNRIEYLKKCLNAILKQSVEVQNIVIVNNNSVDGTKEYLNKLKSSQIIPIHLESNVGGAGGFSFGMKYVLNNFDDSLMWIMDDDTLPVTDCVEKLLKKAKKLSDVGFLASNVRWVDGSPALLNIPLVSGDWNSPVEKNVVKVKDATFVSLLVPQYVVKDIGFPMADFFIDADDVEYTMRINEKYNGYFVADSIVIHDTVANNKTNILDADLPRLWRYFYSTRNDLYIKRVYGGKTKYLRGFLKNLLLIIKIMFSRDEYKLKKCQVIFKGTLASIVFHPNK